MKEKNQKALQPKIKKHLRKKLMLVFLKMKKILNKKTCKINSQFQ